MQLWCPILAAALTSAQLFEQPAQLRPQYATACGLLDALFPEQVLKPGDADYARSQQLYWSVQQAELTPSCRFQPEGARDIQIALADVLIPANATIAIASGGHSSVEGASNINEGVTIDLSRMSHVHVGDLGKTVTLGPGARWRDVYYTLENQNLTVPGGRVGHVGVGGYVLGGGFSWFANEHGWACDSVIEFEIVTPQAEILWVNSGNYEDLFWALKGSLGAYGIVTKIKMSTLPNRPVYAGALTYSQQYIPRLCDALANLGVAADNDLATQGYLSFAWIQAEHRFDYTAYLMNTAGESFGDAIAAFKVIPHEGDSLQWTNISKSADEIDKSNPLGFRRFKFTLTSFLNPKAMLAMHEVVKGFASTVKFDEKGVLGVTFQPLTTSHLKAQNNIFNLNASQGPLLLVSVEFWWSDADRDIYFDTHARKLQHEMESKLKEMKALHHWLYPNYASREQNPFGTLDPVTMKMLAATKRKYDPAGLWGKLVPGLAYLN